MKGMLPDRGRAAFLDAIDVSRETLARLEAYVALLETWNRRITLVARRSLDDVWRRHILDSAQLAALLPSAARVLLDLGSGAGFPGLVLALLTPGLTVHLIEADRRKAVFLREACRVHARWQRTIVDCSIGTGSDRRQPGDGYLGGPSLMARIGRFHNRDFTRWQPPGNR